MKRISLNMIMDYRKNHLTDNQFVNLLSVIVGLIVGFAAVIIKNSVYLIQNLLKTETLSSLQHYFYFVYPIFGILLAILFVRFFIKGQVEHGIPSVLYAISETKGHIKHHNLFSSIITSALTVGFGGSVGLEGPTVATGAAYGSAIGRIFKLNYKYIILLLGAACTGAMAAIFKAPIAGVVFALEVIMIDLTVGSILPLLIASVTATLTSYFFMGPDVLYHFELKEGFQMTDLHLYLMLGIMTGLISVYFTKIYIGTHKFFERFKNKYIKLILSGLGLGILIFLFPALYGEGYEVINEALSGNSEFIWTSSLLAVGKENFYMSILIILGVILTKSFATSLTFTAGGVGGIFAPTLFSGSLSGLLFATILNNFGYHFPVENFALAAMAGAIAGVLQAPLTAIFLIAEISGGYQMLIPLMIVSLVSYLTSRIFIKNSVYTYQLAQRGQLLTHHTDKNMLKLLDFDSLIEKDFIPIQKGCNLGDLVNVISKSSRNITPVLDGKKFVGMIHFTDIRSIAFRPTLYEKVKISELTTYPKKVINHNDSMEDIAQILSDDNAYNVPVVENGEYIGFISRANFFHEYRKQLKEFSDF